MFWCIIRPLSLLAHPYIFLLDKTPFWRNSALLTRRHATSLVTLFFVLTHVTYVTQWSSGAVPVLLDLMPHQWSPGDLPRVLRMWESVFTLRRLLACYPFCFLKASLGPAAQPGVSRASCWYSKYTVFTWKSACARKSASLELAPPVWLEIFNERLPRMSAPLEK